MSTDPIHLVVVHWNQPQECVATIRQFLAQQMALKISIVDNASTPDALGRLKREFGDEIEIVGLEENNGWGQALNVALTNWLASGQERYCLISAHDAEPSEKCVRLLVEAMEHDPRIGIASPQYPDATVPHFSCLRGVWQGRGVPLPSGTAELVDVPHGTLFLVRRECLADIGLFDKRYFAYGDEHELGLRAFRRGWKIVLVWGAVVTNRGTWTSSPWRSYLFTRNSLLLVHDYCGLLFAWLRAALILVSTARLMVFSPNEGFAFSPRARWLGVRDYFAGRFGRPRIGSE